MIGDVGELDTVSQNLVKMFNSVIKIEFWTLSPTIAK